MARSFNVPSLPDDADGTLSLDFSERAEKLIDGQPQPALEHWFVQMQRAVAKGQIGVWRDHGDPIGLRGHAITGLDHAHRRARGEQVRGQALMGRVEVLNDDECRYPLA